MASQNDKLSRFRELFPDDASKARAFEEIAAQFYAGNFGRMTKTDFETLMFHLYIEQILETDAQNFGMYSDFRLAKELGISQSKVSNLKVKKQLQYPHEFEWRESFARVSANARYENGKIKIQIPDINLYYEIKNAVEEAGGYIDVTLTSKLLQISPEYFLDLLVAVSEDDERDELRKKLRAEIRKQNQDQEYLEQTPLGKQLLGLGKDVVINVISGAINGSSSNTTKALGETVLTLLKNNLTKSKEN